MNIRYVKILFTASLVCMCLGMAYNYVGKKVTRIELPKGELKWTDVRPRDAKMCIPAAFTDESGRISGSYRCQGKTYQNGKTLNMKVSLKGESFYISKNWLSDNGFQQLTLVYNSQPMKFHDSRKAIRRALCKDDKVAFILQSNYPITLSDFALECSRHCTNATYLDMGEYGYGYIKTKHFVRPLYVWGLFAKYKQTNWLYIQ